MEALFVWMQQLYDALASTTQLSPWAYLLVTAGGVISAISPCFMPVVAMFGGYVGGYAQENKAGGLRLALPFVLGNTVTLAATGGIVSFLGNSVLHIFTGYELDRWVPGIVGLLMALELLGFLHLKIPTVPIFRWSKQPGTGWGSFALGLPFGLVVTPCTIPIFSAIATFVAFQGSVLHGALLMAVYALGRGAILLAVAVSVGLLKALNVGHTAQYIERISGILILVASLGLLLFYKDFVQFTGQWMPMAR